MTMSCHLASTELGCVEVIIEMAATIIVVAAIVLLKDRFSLFRYSALARDSGYLALLGDIVR